MNKQTNKRIEFFRFKRFARKSYSVFNSLRKVVTIGVLSSGTLISAHAISVGQMERVNISSSLDSISGNELSEVVVASTKVDLPIDIAAKQVTIISKQEVEQSGVKSIQDLLNYVAGVDVLQRSPHGVQADISIRGGSFEQVAILLNGINLSSPQTGHYSFDIPINISDIERIEIVQGPTSLLYGSNALMGGINIITKKDSFSNIYAKLEGGMHGLISSELRGAYRYKSFINRVSAGYSRSSGYIKNSDYNIFNALLQSTYDIKNVGYIDFQLGYNDKSYGANTFYSAAYPNQFDATKSIFASIKGESYGKLKFIPQMYWNRHYDRFELIRQGSENVPAWYKDHNYHLSDVFGVNLNIQYKSFLGVTSFGGEIRNENVLSNVLGKPMTDTIVKYTKTDNRTNISSFIEHNFIFNKFTISIGGLFNINTSVVNRAYFYPSVNTSFRVIDNLTLYASWNMATRMPSFTDLYYSTKTHVGNPKLLPEQTMAAEGGVKYKNDYINFNSYIFYTAGKNIIDWQYSIEDNKWHSINMSNDKSLKTLGCGASFILNFQELIKVKQPLNSINISYQFLNQNNQYAAENNPISKYIFNYLKHKLTINLQHDIIKNLSVGWNLRCQDRAGAYLKYIDLKPAEKEDYKPFAILDIKVNYRIKWFNIFVNANNIFNTKFVDYGNIPQPEFWISGGLSFRFQ